MNMVHEFFLVWLHHETEHQRLENYKVYDGYYNGDHEIDIPAKVKAALDSELGTVLNYTRIVVDAAVDYIAGGEVGIECPDSPEAEAFLYEVYEDNNLLNEEMLKVLTVMGKKGDVFLKLYIEDGAIKVSVLKPDACFPRYRTDGYKEMLYCAIKWWEDADEFEGDSSGKWKAQVFRPDRVDYYELEGNTENQNTSWELVKTESNPLGFIPIIHIKNTIDDLEFGVSDIQIVADLQDALNKMITDMVLAMDQNAFQRLWIFGAQTPPGYEVSMEAGTITEVPNEEGHLAVVAPASIEPFIQAIREIVDQLMTVAQLSKVTIMKPDVPLPPSGFALRIYYIPLERKAGKKITILQNRFQELNQMIFRAGNILGKPDYVGEKSKLHFAGGLPIDEQMQMAVDEMEIRSKIRSRRTIMEKRGVEDIEKEMKLIAEEADEEAKREIELAKAVAAVERQNTATQ